MTKQATYHSRCRLIAGTFFALAIFIFSFQSRSFGQSSDPLHNAYVEVWGNTGLWSLNYDYIFRDNYGLRFGIMGEPKSGPEASLNSFGIVSTANLLLGPNSHKAELGAGGYLEINQGTGSEDLFLTTTIGYRYQGLAGGWIIRTGFTPAFNSDEFIWRFGLSVGRVLR